MYNRITHFEIHASEPEKLAKFYSEVFGWEIKEYEMGNVKEENRYWGVMTAPKDSTEPGINGGLVVRRGSKPVDGQPVNAFVCTTQVPNIDEYLKKVETAGGTIAVGKMPIMGMAWIAYGKDLDGNIFGLYQEDKSAK